LICREPKPISKISPGFTSVPGLATLPFNVTLPALVTSLAKVRRLIKRETFKNLSSLIFILSSPKDFTFSKIIKKKQVHEEPEQL
jgi:hypothetical protein